MNHVAEKMNEKDMDWLYDYVETSHFSESLFEIIVKHQSNHNQLYRGIKYPITKLVVGETYQHDYPITSWTLNKAFAVDISLNKKLPYRAYEDAYFEKHGKEKEGHLMTDAEHIELAKKFCPIVLIGEDLNGLEVNKHILEHEWKNEEEVVVYEGTWTITKIEECVEEGKTYYEVQVEKVLDEE